MKTKILLSIIICLTYAVQVNSQNWLWAKQAGGSYYDYLYGSCQDQNNNTYIAGQFFSDTCYFDTIKLYCIGCSSAMSGKAFLAKYNSNGALQWAKSFGDWHSFGGPIAYDAYSNSLYIGGCFNGTCNFGCDTLTATGNYSAFLTKLDVSGNCLWSKKVGGSGSSASCVSQLTVTQYGEVIASFVNNAAMYFDTIFVDRGCILTKYDGNGNCLWAKKKFDYVNLGINGYNFTGHISKLHAHNDEIFAVGFSRVDSFVLDTIAVQMNLSNRQSFIIKFDSSGISERIKTQGGYSSYLSVDGFGNIYLTGSYKDTAVFETDTLFNANPDMFIAKYDSSFNLKWKFSGNSSNRSSSGGLSFINSDKEFYVAGSFTGTNSFGAYTLNSISPDGDMFFARYDSSGNCIGIRHVGNAQGGNVFTDANQSVYLSGDFFNSASFGSTQLTSLGGGNIFVAKSTAITGIGDVQRKSNNQLIIYANPTTGKCNVTVPDDFLNEKNLLLSIFDNSGKMIQQKSLEMNGDKIKLNLEAEAKGVYNISLSNGRKSYSGKIVFQ